MVSQSFTLTLGFAGDVRRLVLFKGDQETYLHIIIKILAYIYFWDDELTIEPKFRYHGYRPDLLRLDKPENPKLIEKEIGLWVECKQVKLSKLDDLVRYSQAPIYWFHTLNHLKRGVKPGDYKKFSRLHQVNMIGIQTQDKSSGLSDMKKLTRSLQSNPAKWRVEWVSNELLKVYLPDEIDAIEVAFINI